MATAGELIDILSKFDPTLDVVVKGDHYCYDIWGNGTLAFCKEGLIKDADEANRANVIVLHIDT